LDHEIACEPSDPRAQELIDQVNLLQLGKSARYEVINYYSGNDTDTARYQMFHWLIG